MLQFPSPPTPPSDLDFARYLRFLSIQPLPPPRFDAPESPSAPPSPVEQAPVLSAPQPQRDGSNTIPSVLFPWNPALAIQAPVASAELLTSVPGGDLFPREIPQKKKKKTKMVPTRCPLCQLILTKLSVLVQHERVHTGEKPFICEYCSHRFSLKCNLTRHGKTCRSAPRTPSSSPPRASSQSKVNVDVHRGVDENVLYA